jgi:hypothetical protein
MLNNASGLAFGSLCSLEMPKRSGRRMEAAFAL